MLLNERPRGIALNKNALNIQSNPQSKSPSPPQLKAWIAKSENDEPPQALKQQQQKQPQLVVVNKSAENDEPIQVLKQQQGFLRRERPKSLIPRLINEPSAEPVEDIDQPSGRDAHFMVCDVAKDIFTYMFELEKTLAIKEDYLKDQKIFTSKVRHRLISWCVQINSTLKLLPETMYTTISILDRYFQNVIIQHQEQVQLIAITATLIASKYEEIYPPEIDELTYLTQNAYTKRDVLKMEIEILEKLKFDLGKPIPLAFLRRFSKAAHCDLKMHSMAKQIMEISLPHYECAHWSPSMLAATALFITIYLTFHDNTFARWNKTLIHYTTYTRQQLMEPATTLCKILKSANSNPKLPELKSLYVDKLIKIGGNHKLGRS